MSSKLMCAVLVAASSLITACAGLTTKVVTDDGTDRGVRFYRNVPYLLVTTNNQGGVTSEIIHLPDTSELMSAYVFSNGASNDTTLKFTNGVLTSSTTEVDTSVIPKAVLTAVASAAGSAFSIAGGGGDAQRRAPGPSLYRIKVRGNTAQLIGSDEIITINIGSAGGK